MTNLGREVVHEQTCIPRKGWIGLRRLVTKLRRVTGQARRWSNPYDATSEEIQLGRQISEKP